MKKNYSSLFVLIVMILLSGKSFGQKVIPCYTDEMARKYKLLHPEITLYEKQLNAEIADFIKNKRPHLAGRTTANDPTNDSFYFDIPVVVHVMHEYGAEVIDDRKIYALISEMNRFYSKNYNTSGIVPEFQPYIGTPRFRFHLAIKDPNGNPTKGITHHFTYLASGGDDQGKLDQWSPSSYLNIWFEQRIGAVVPDGIIVAYATQPASAAADPYSDGIICNYTFINDTGATGVGSSIDHETGHIFNLNHTFGQTNDPATPGESPTEGNCDCATCSDLVDDTPPTPGSFSTCNLYDTVCSKNYFVVYPSAVSGVDSIADYPDTAYEQDIMNYGSCSNDEFTLGQIARMRAAALSDVGGRSNLWSPSNLFFTGILTDSVTYAFAPIPDLAPITDFAVKNSGGTLNSGTYTLFTCPGVKLSFINESYQDTITSVEWKFSNTATITDTTITAPSSIGLGAYVRPSFTDPGWVSVTLAATGNNTGTTTTTYPRAAFVADAAGTPGDGYYMEFNNSDTTKWPMFNYFNNGFKWQMANVGYYDHSSVMYQGYDTRILTLTGTPVGDYDDLFSVPMDLSSFTDTCNLNFMYSAASRTSNGYDINDTLDIYYSTNSSVSWVKLKSIAKGDLINKGVSSIPYVPSGMNDWAPKTIGIPHAARTNYVIFRFRYRPNVSLADAVTGYTYSTGNNFYMDRINFSRSPAAVSTVKLNDLDVMVVPNPTNGDAYVVLKDASAGSVQIVVTDITGKVVYNTTEPVNGATRVQIPHAVINATGVYMVQTITGSQVNTQKLVVE